MITWDEEKREQVLQEHHVDFEKILDVFNDPFAITSTITNSRSKSCEP